MFSRSRGGLMRSGVVVLSFLLILLSISPSMFLFPVRTAWASGRAVDVYTQYPAPDGGQGERMPSNPFRPMTEVILYAYVTYNLDPLAGRIVAFEISHGEWNFILSNVTGSKGVASVKFRIPWPDSEPEARVLGVWNVTAAVNIAGVVMADTLWFYVSLTDLNCDGRVDVKDVVIVAIAFGSYPGHLRWNPLADISIDERIDVRDIAKVAKDYGWSQ